MSVATPSFRVVSFPNRRRQRSSDPGGYINALTNNPLPNTPSHRVIVQYNLGDAQVSWLGAETMGRTIGASMFPSNVREDNEELFGFPVGNGPFTSGSVIQGWTYDVPTVPQTNIPPPSQYDTHECVRRDPRAQQQMGTLA